MTPRFFFYLLLLLAASVYGLSKYQNFSSPFRWLAGLILWVFLIESASRVSYYVTGYSYPAYHLYIVVAAIYNGVIYIKLLPQEKTYRYAVFALVAVALAIQGFCIAYYRSLLFFPSLGMISLSFLVAVLALLLFAAMLRYPSPINILKQPAFWFNSGNLFFYTVTFFIFGYFEYMLSQDQQVPTWGYYLIWVANIILYSCYFYSLFLQAQNRKKLS